jgi:hypothetical protein
MIRQDEVLVGGQKRKLFISNSSNFDVTVIQIDEFGEVAQVKLENEDEHRVLNGADGSNQIVWMSAQREKDSGLKD